MDIHLIGPYPPPYGGVSVHIYRLQKRLHKDGYHCVVWGAQHNPAKSLYRLGNIREAIHKLSNLPDKSILHFHSLHSLAGMMTRRKKVVLFTVHNERANRLFRETTSLRRRVANMFHKRSFLQIQKLIAVSDRAKSELIKFGFSQSKIVVCNAYLRPDAEEKTGVTDNRKFEAFRRKFHTLAAANAGELKFLDGVDIYGIDLCVEMICRLKESHPGLGLVLVIPNSSNNSYLERLRAKTLEMGASDNILWLYEPGFFHPLLRQCDIYIRPTNTDGYSVSIAEAMEYGVPVVASDAVSRPRGCLLFKNRDLTDLTEKMHYAIANNSKLSHLSLENREVDHFKEILEIYRTLI